MADLPGFTRLGGKSRRVRAPDGSEISRRQYENVKARAAGFTSWSQWQSLRKDRQYKRWLQVAERQHGKGQREPNSTFNTLYMRAHNEHRALSSSRIISKMSWEETMGEPDSPFDDLLVYLGLRDPENDWNIGDTP